jgi:uncharacterized protein
MAGTSRNLPAGAPVRTPLAPALAPHAWHPLGVAGRSWVLSALALASLACAPASVVVTPTEPATPVCRIDGCRPPAATGGSASGVAAVCSSAGDAPCGGESAERCTERALAAWADALDDRGVACVARMLSEACSLEDARACGFAGRLWLQGRGVARDVRRGMDMVVRSCDGGFPLACAAGVRWLHEATDARDIEGADDLRARLQLEQACLLGQPDACFHVGVHFYFGQDKFPLDRRSASVAYARGCDLGEPRACNNLGDGLAYGDGVVRDVERAAAAFSKACRLGEALGCANLGYMAEHGEGVVRDLARARALYRDACLTGDVYGCLHADMLAALDSGVPRAPSRAFAHWRRACDQARDARACAFVGVMYVDGPDGLARDEAMSQKAMTRACDLGDKRACEWLAGHTDE